MNAEIFHGFAASLVTIVADALEAGSPAGRPARVQVTWGEIALDDCDCGILAISLGRRADYAQFPVEISSTALRSNAQGACATSPMQDYTLHLARCQPTVGDRGDPPTPAVLGEAARIAAVDTEIVRCTLLTTLSGWQTGDTILNHVVNASQPVGPEGACGGYATPFIIGL